MAAECALRPGTELNIEDVSKIALALKSLATYSMLAYEHDDDPEDLQGIVDDGLNTIDKLFDC
jgi:hypothetical protein